jgi:hypothetical protein
MIKKLPIFKGWTVDLRVREFRKVHYDATGQPCGMEWLRFDTQEGDELLGEFIETIDKNSPLWQEIVNLW